MIKSLRIRFIAVAFSLVAAVVAGIVTVINIVSFSAITENADDVLSSLILYNEQTGDYFIADRSMFELPPAGDPTHQSSVGERNIPFDRRSDIGKAPKNDTLASARFFAVTISQDGEMLSYNIDNITEIDGSSATADAVLSYAKTAYSSAEENSYINYFRYKKAVSASGAALILFLDREEDLSRASAQLLVNILIGVIALAVLFAITFFLSRAALSPAEKAYEKQKRFITDAGHDLKTPLTVISANAELLESETGKNEWIDGIKNQVKKLSSLTKNLISLARLDESGSNYVFTDFSLSEALIETAEPFKAIALSKNKTMIIQTKDVTAHGNEELLRQAMGLLIDNAIKYSDGDEITLSVSRSGRYAIFQTENDCRTLPNGDNSQLFERFYRADPSRNQAVSGNGLGLSVVRSIAKEHKGKATCFVENGKITFKLMI